MQHRGLVAPLGMVVTSAIMLLAIPPVAGQGDAAAAAAPLCGDCDHDNQLTIDELITAVGLSLTECPVAGGCCGDCDLDGCVKINEIITALNSFFGSELAACGLDCFGPCYFPIAGDPPCPCPGGECSESLILVESDRTIHCGASICYRTGDQYRSCVLLLRNTTDFCFDEFR